MGGGNTRRSLMDDSMPPTCDYCHRVILASKPERKGDQQFCNAICLTGFEIDEQKEQRECRVE